MDTEAARHPAVARPSHPVLRVLLERREAGSRPGSRTDGHRVGLAVEGGAVRGVVSGGMLVALEELGLRDAFDVVYGSSAGSFNAAYFLADRARDALPLYADRTTRRHFMDARRLLRGRPLLSLSWVLDHAMRSLVPLDWEAVAGGPVPLCVCASSVDDLAPVVLCDLRSPDELRSALRAGATIPFLAGPPVRFRGMRLLDASVLQAHPFEAAVAGGCTHVLSLSTRPRDRSPDGGRLVNRLAAWRLERLRRGLGAGMLRRADAYARAQRRLEALTADPGAPPLVCDVAPPRGSRQVPLFTRDAGRVLEGAAVGRRSLMAALDGRGVERSP
jgi:predicted patatin/cPLA2 family phospholipase